MSADKWKDLFVCFLDERAFNVMKKFFLFSNLFLGLFLSVASKAEETTLDAKSDPNVDAVRLTQHFKKADPSPFYWDDPIGKFIDGAKIVGVNTVVYGGSAVGIATGTILISKAKERDGIISKLVKKGFKVTGITSSLYLIADGASRIVLNFQELDPGFTAVPGMASFIVRETDELIAEAPHRVKQQAAHAKNEFHRITKESQDSFNGKMEE